MIDWLHSLMPWMPIERVWSMVLVPVIVVIGGLLIKQPGSDSGADRGRKHPESGREPPQ